MTGSNAATLHAHDSPPIATDLGQDLCAAPLCVMSR